MAKRSVRGDRVTRAGDRAVYIISVAAELAGVHPQTLRIYERRGLLTPARTAGNTRRYSDRDIARLRTIQRLTQERGLNLAGVKMIVEMEDELDRLRRRMERMDRELELARQRLQEEVERVRAEHPRGEIIPLATIRKMMRIAAAGNTRAPGEGGRGPIPVGPGEG
jgi:MerR family transcriptional regulator, heat shock protein HspR